MRKVVLVIGAATLDRSLYVEKYPKADTKDRCRTIESGGGNAANTASTLGRLLLLSSSGHGTHDEEHKQFGNKNQLVDNDFCVQLLTKISRDEIGQSIMKELESYGVDTSSPLLVRTDETLKSQVVTVIVTNTPPTRTCLFDPGTVGTLEPPDLDQINIRDIMTDVIHYHSDTRHTEVAVELARVARTFTKQKILISVDVERDRFSAEFDDLIDLADIVFTNSNLMRPILTRRLNHDPYQNFEVQIEKMDNTATARQFDDFYFNVVLLHHYLDELRLKSMNASGRGGENNEETERKIIATRGQSGAMHCQKISSKTSKERASVEIIEPFTKNLLKVNSYSKGILHISHMIQKSVDGNESLNHGDFGTKFIQMEENDYIIHSVGPPKDIKIVDTTGAGDAFIGGYIFSKNNLSDRTHFGDASAEIFFHLRFASWVAGRKIGGVGTRSTLPTRAEVQAILGKSVAEMDEKLQELTTDPF